MQVAQATTRTLARWRDAWLSGWRVSAIVPAGLALALVFGVAVAEGGIYRDLAVALVCTAALIPISRALFFRRIQYGFPAVEVPLLLLLISNLVFRIRSATDIAVDPLTPLPSSAWFRPLVLGLGGSLISLSHEQFYARVMAPPVVMRHVIIVFPVLRFPSICRSRSIAVSSSAPPWSCWPARGGPWELKPPRGSRISCTGSASPCLSLCGSESCCSRTRRSRSSRMTRSAGGSR